MEICVNMYNKITRIAKFALIAPAFFISVGVFAAGVGEAAEIAAQAEQTNRTITGKVTDSEGAPVAGAYIVVQGTNTGTVTDGEGNYSLNAPEGATLEVSCIGFVAQEIAAGTRSRIDITLAQDTQMMEDVVVIGYGTQRKGDVSSAISTVRSENFVKVPTTNVAQLIRGQVAGLAVSTPDGNPLGSTQVLLRGTGTLRSSTDPLVLIDGIPGTLNQVSPDDVAQIDILKDGSAAAIYGTRGSAGVILITTKNSVGEMPTEVDINAYVSTQQITRKLDFMTADEYREIVKLGKSGAVDDKATTDWLKEVMLAFPLTQVYNIGIRGGSKTTNYVASFDFRRLNGLMKRTQNTMIFPRLEVTHRMFNNKLKINGGISGYKQDYWAGSDNDNGYNTAVYRNAITYNPTTPVRDAEGNWSEKPAITDYLNPVALTEEIEGKNQGTNMRMFAALTYTPFSGLDIRYLYSSNIYNQARGYYETSRHINSSKSARTGFASRGTNRTQDDKSELTINWRETFGDHALTVMGGYDWERRNYQFYWMQNFNFPSDDYTYNGIQNGQALRDGRANISSVQQENARIAWLGRVNYSFKGRYMLNASIRYEGSSKFGVNNKWGLFPAVSGAWSIKDEAFLRDNHTVSTLKLRVGYGVTGTEPLDPYMSQNTLSFGTYTQYDGEWVKSVRPASNANPDLRWERKSEINAGLDIGLFQERLNMTIDYYNRKTVDAIFGYNVPLPPFLYGSMNGNGGSIRNAGIEVSVSAIPVQTKDFTWNTSVNFSTNKNTVLSLSSDQFIASGYSDQGWISEPMQTYTHRVQEGQPIGNFYGFKSVDIDNDGFWIIEGADGNPKSINDQLPDDKKIIGNALPRYYLNFNNTLSYKNWDVNVTMRGAFKFHILNYPAVQFGNPTMLTRGNLLNATWEKKYDKVPLNDTQGVQYVSYYVEKGDYWKIDNVTLGYTLDFDSDWIKSIRLYGTVSNLATITGYSGIDPEVRITGMAPGVDELNRYPATRTFTFGASLKF